MVVDQRLAALILVALAGGSVDDVLELPYWYRELRVMFRGARILVGPDG